MNKLLKLLMWILFLAIIYLAIGIWLAFFEIKHPDASKIDIILKMPYYAWQEIKTFVLSI